MLFGRLFYPDLEELTQLSLRQLYAARGWQQDDHFYMYHRYPLFG